MIKSVRAIRAGKAKKADIRLAADSLRNISPVVSRQI